MSFLKDSFDSKKYLESYEKVLVAWTSIKDALDDGNENEIFHSANSSFADGSQSSHGRRISGVLMLKNYAHTVVDAFLQSRLSSFNAAADKDVFFDHLLSYFPSFSYPQVC